MMVNDAGGLLVIKNIQYLFASIIMNIVHYTVNIATNNVAVITIDPTELGTKFVTKHTCVHNMRNFYTLIM